MEEAVTRKFVHEDSSHIISFCGESPILAWGFGAVPFLGTLQLQHLGECQRMESLSSLCLKHKTGRMLAVCAAIEEGLEIIFLFLNSLEDWFS